MTLTFITSQFSRRAGRSDGANNNNRAVFLSSRVPGRIYPECCRLPPSLAASDHGCITDSPSLWSLSLHLSVCLSLNIPSLSRCQSLESGPTLLILSAKTLFPYQVTPLYREVSTSCFLDVGHNSTFNRWYPRHSLCSSLWTMNT